MGDDGMQIVVAAAAEGKNVEAQYVEMMVPLYSYGCHNKISKALSHLKGIYSVNVNFHEQKVSVWGICDKDKVLSIVKKTRKNARFWNSEDDQSVQHLQFNNTTTSSSSPQPRPLSSIHSKRYLQTMMIKGSSSFKLHFSLLKSRSLNWHKALYKPFARSNSF